MDQPQEIIDKVRGSLSTLKHDINNPVAVISGNAQLLKELARMDQHEDYLESIEDIEEASSQIRNLLERLDLLAEYLDQQGASSKEKSIF